MTADPRDLIIQEHAPLVGVPVYGELAPLEHSGHRYIAARERLLIEVRRPWLHLRWPLTQGAIAPALPYGQVEQRIELAFRLPRPLLQRFLADATKYAPFEWAAWLVWNARDQCLEYRELDMIEFGSGCVRYHRPALDEHESLAVDLHSHGELDAFFSATDDNDDAGEVKLAGVVGGLRPGGTTNWKLRLCALGLHIDLPGPRDL